MNTLVTIEVGKVTGEVKGLTLIKQTRLKTKTKLEINITKKDQGFQSIIEDEISLLQIEGEKVDSLMIIVEGTKAIRRLENRSVSAFSKLGFTVNELDWGFERRSCHSSVRREQQPNSRMYLQRYRRTRKCSH